MKFKFAFQKILAHKITLEDIARRDWAEAQARLNEAMKQIDDMYLQIDEARQLGSKREVSGAARGFELAQVDDFINGHKIRIERHRLKVRELMGQAEHFQELLVLAARERKTFEKLREKRMEEFKLRVKKHELKVMDEIVVTRFKRAADEDSGK